MVEGLACVRSERELFRDLSFRLGSGAALVLRGPNGAGKSSLLRVLAGLLPAAGGRVLWDGVDTTDRPGTFHRALCYVGHQDALKPTMTVAENLGFWAGLGGGGEVAPALRALGLAALASLPTGILSAGQRRRLNLARLVAAPSRLWLLDEPTVTLDSGALDRLTDLVRRHRDGGGIVVAATHADWNIGACDRLDLGAGP